MSKAGLKINPRVHTDKSLIERFYDFPVANVGDAQKQLLKKPLLLIRKRQK